MARFFKIIFIFLTAAMSCFYLHTNFSEISPVLASSLIGFISTLIPWQKFSWSKAIEVEMVAYSGTFAGMSASFFIPQIHYFLLPALIAGIFFKLSERYFLGWGGKLGTLAFFSVLIFAL